MRLPVNGRIPTRVDPLVLAPLGEEIRKLCQQLPGPVRPAQRHRPRPPARTGGPTDEARRARRRSRSSALLLVAGCGPRLKDVPLPGTGVSGDTITVEADFDEALNLAEGATGQGQRRRQRQGPGRRGRGLPRPGRDAGEDRRRAARGRHRPAALHDAAGRAVRRRHQPGEGRRRSRTATTLALADTSTAPTVEDALAQASLLVNGGGLEQLQTVTEELNTAIGGREDDGAHPARPGRRRSSPRRTRRPPTSTGRSRPLSSVSKTLRGREQVINRAVREIRPAAAGAAREHPGLTELLAEIEDFSAAANDDGPADPRRSC